MGARGKHNIDEYNTCLHQAQTYWPHSEETQKIRIPNSQ
jgi:hypothetical protein